MQIYADLANMQMAETKVIESQLSYALNGILFAAHNALGRYSSESQYADAVEQELRRAAIRYERERVLPPAFDGERPGRNRVDFLIEERIVIELKAKPVLEREDYAQVLRYLRALNCKLGLLVNFRMRTLTPKRVLNSLA